MVLIQVWLLLHLPVASPALWTSKYGIIKRRDGMVIVGLIVLGFPKLQAPELKQMLAWDGWQEIRFGSGHRPVGSGVGLAADSKDPA